MKIKKIATLILILVITASLIITNKIKAANSSVTYHVRAHVSDDFVESVGINTKFGFCPGRLCDNYSQVKALLADLGIRYIRDIAYDEPQRTRTDLYRDLGIRMVVGVEPSGGLPLNSTANIVFKLNIIKSWGAMIAGIVGVNEYDLPGFYSCQENPQNCDPSWSKESWSKNYSQFQRQLYDRVKKDPDLGHLPVIMGPMAHLSNLKRIDNLGDVCDRGNDHSYPGGWGKPSQESGWGKKSVRSMEEVVAEVHQVCPNRPLWITETGYEEVTGQDPHKNLVSRRAKAKYLPRIYANYYLQGIEKTFLFELLSAVATQPTRFGIIDPDLQPTPAYYGIQKMISLLEEATWNSSTQSWQYPNFQPSFLKYTLEGDLSNIEHLLLQKSDGTFYLLIWQEVYVYDSETGEDLINSDRTIDFKLPESTIAQANQYFLYNNDFNAELVPLETWTNESTISLNVPDHILALEFRLKN